MVDITGAAAADKKRRQEQGKYKARMRKLANPEIATRNKKRISGESDKAKVSYEAMKQNRKLSAFFNEEEDKDD